MSKRIQKSSLPSQLTLCCFVDCVYNDDYYCDDPRNNKGNSDAECHDINNKDLLAAFKEAKELQMTPNPNMLYTCPKCGGTEYNLREGEI